MNACRTEFSNKQQRKRIAELVKECEHNIVYIYGPYPPAAERTKWRIVIYDPSTGKRKSLCAETRGAADLLAVPLYLGLRPSEVLGLTVGAVDGINVFVNGTKNQNAKRRLELYAPVAKILAKHCAKRPLSERIFASDRAQKPAPNWMYKRLHTYCDEAQVARVCPHSLRGLHSSLALEAGATSNDVARSLGHSSFAITAKHYAKADSIEVGKARRMAGSLHAKTR